MIPIINITMQFIKLISLREVESKINNNLPLSMKNPIRKKDIAENKYRPKFKVKNAMCILFGSLPQTDAGSDEHILE